MQQLDRSLVSILSRTLQLLRYDDSQSGSGSSCS
jgi:hypothetical protein